MRDNATSWRRLGERIEQSGVGCGMCAVIDAMDPTHDGSMNDRIYQHIDVDVESRGRPFMDTPGVSDARILACYFLALECDEEAKTR